MQGVLVIVLMSGGSAAEITQPADADIRPGYRMTLRFVFNFVFNA